MLYHKGLVKDHKTIWMKFPASPVVSTNQFLIEDVLQTCAATKITENRIYYYQILLKLKTYSNSIFEKQLGAIGRVSIISNIRKVEVPKIFQKNFNLSHRQLCYIRSILLFSLSLLICICLKRLALENSVQIAKIIVDLCSDT